MQVKNVCMDDKTWDLFDGSPMDRKLNSEELSTFKTIIENKERNKAKLFL